MLLHAVFSWFDSNPGMFSPLSAVCLSMAVTLECRPKQPLQEYFSEVASVRFQANLVSLQWESTSSLNSRKWTKHVVYIGLQVTFFLCIYKLLNKVYMKCKLSQRTELTCYRNVICSGYLGRWTEITFNKMMHAQNKLVIYRIIIECCSPCLGNICDFYMHICMLFPLCFLVCLIMCSVKLI